MKLTAGIIGCAVAAVLASVPVSAQIGRRFPSEKKVIRDPKTGVELVFLTSQQGKGDSKIYQTHNQWTSDGKWVIFRSNRVPGEAMAVNEETGVMVQVTEGGYSGMLCVARNSMHLYIQRPDMTDKQKEEVQQLRARQRAGEQVAYFRLDPDYARKFPIAEQIAPSFGPRNMGAGPGGIGKIDLNTGKAEPVVSVHFKVGHIQGNPWHPGEVIFCWETGGKAPQRTWMVNSDGTNLRPIYRETEYDWVTHEAVISEDELVIAILGHRRIALDGRNLDTSKDWGPSGTKEYATGMAVVNMRTRELTLEGQVDGDSFWHVAGSQDGHWVAGDDFARELWLVDRHTKERILLTAGHKITAQDHVHPTFKPDGTEIEIQSAMLSEDNRSMNICLVRLPQELIERYKK